MDDFDGLGPDTTAPSMANATMPPPDKSDEYDGLGPDTADWTGSAGTTSPSLGSKIVKYSPIGAGALAVDTIGKGFGYVSDKIGKGYNALVGQPTAGTQAIANAPKTVLEGLAGLEQIPENGLKELTSLATGQGLSMRPQPWQDIISNSPGVKNLDEDTRQELSKDVGTMAEPLADPMWAASPFGKTRIGEQAAKDALLEPNLAKAGQAGQRALITVAGKPVIQGQPILNAIGKGQEVLRKHFPGLHTLTDDAAQNKLIESTLKSPENAANVHADILGGQMKDAIKRNAEIMQTTPEELSRIMMDLRENPNKELMAQLPEEVRDMIVNQTKSNAGMALNEGMVPTENYLHHSGTPEYNKFLNDTFNKVGGEVGGASPKNDNIAAHEPKNINMTANEANNLFQSGRGDEVFPNSPFKDQFKKFTGKVFSDDIAHIEADRFLQNAKVNRVSDFMSQVEKQYGKTKEAVGAGMADGSIQPKEYTQVKSPHFEDGEKWFPKQLADFIDGVQNPKQAEMAQGWSKNWLQNTSTLTKLVNFGLKPASAPFNYLSNLNLQFLNKNLSPTNVIKGLKIVANDRMGKLSDKVVLHSPLYGDITEQQLMDMAHEHRGIGMGVQKSEIGNARLPQKLRDNPVSKGAMAVHMFAEDASRLPAFMTELEHGATWEGAAQKTRETLYDYDNIGKTDKKIAQYVPFYRFARLNMPTMIQRMITDPARTFALEKTREAWNKSQGQQENEDLLPDYKRMEEPWYAGKNEQGQPIWVQGGRYMTENDINRPVGAADTYGNFHPGQSIMRYMASMVNPFIKTLPEEIMNTNTATGTPIAHDPKQNMGLGEMNNLAPGIDLPSKLSYAFNQMSPFSMARSATDQNVPLKYRLLHQLGGIKAEAQDPEMDAYYKQMGEKKDARELKNNVKYFYYKQARDEANNKPHQAQLDEKAAENAQNELIEGFRKLFATGEDSD